MIWDVTYLDAHNAFHREHLAGEEAEVRAKLAKRGASVVTISQSPRQSAVGFGRGRVFSLETLVDFCHEQTTLAIAGFSPADAILDFADYTAPRYAIKPLRQAANRVQAGEEVAEALKPTGFFPPDFIAFLRLINTGSRVDCFRILRERLEALHKARTKFLTSMFYPTFAIGFCLFITGALQYLFLPWLRNQQYRNVKLPEHGPTSMIFAVNDHVLRFGHFYLLIAIVAVLITATSPWARQKIIYLAMAANRLIAAAVMQYQQLVWVSAFHLSLKAGRTVQDCVPDLPRFMPNLRLQKQMEKVAQDFKTGTRLSDALGFHTSFDPRVRRMVALGEKSDMPGQIERLTGIYFEKLERTCMKITPRAELLALLITGVGVILNVIVLLIPNAELALIQTMQLLKR